MLGRIARRTGVTALAVMLLAGAQAHAVDTPAAAQTSCSWVGSDAPPEERAEMVLAEMTLEEKTQMMGGDRHPENLPTNGYLPPIERLCIPELTFLGGPVGLHYNNSNDPKLPATGLPAAIALASSFDDDLARRYGAVIGDEAKAHGQDVIFGPSVNIIRVARNGRTFENFTEDPYLNSRMAVAEIEGMQRRGVVANIKHYAVNNHEKDRRLVNAVVDERTLHEIYLPAYRAAVQDAKVGSFMCAYNKVNGPYSCENKPLLTDILRDQWGFDGFVLSDYGATHSTVEAANAGLDLELPIGRHFNPELLTAAVENGDIAVETIDEHIRRILTVMFRFGLFDRGDGPRPEIPVEKHGAFARKAAAESMVLLENDAQVLPISDDADSIAVLGAYARDAHPGGRGSSRVLPFYMVDPVEGIKARAGEDVTVEYAQGSVPTGHPPVPSSALSPPGQPEIHGLRGEYYDNRWFDGEPVLTRTDDRINFNWLHGGPTPELPVDMFSVRWTGTLTAPFTGDYTLSLSSDDGSRLFLDGERVINNWRRHGTRTVTAKVHLVKGERYDVRIDYFEAREASDVSFGWSAPGLRSPEIEQAVELAKRSDVAVVMVGGIRAENRDLASLALEGDQDELVRAVAEANPNTVVVVKSGGPVLMPWIDDVSTVLQAWYPGQEDGNVVADVLFGDVNPSGKLPVTFPRSDADLPMQEPSQYPGVDLQAHYTERLKVGYRWYDSENVTPLFPFGHGLSYTDFELSDLTLTPAGMPTSGRTTAQVKVTNTGDRAGAEVVQLYVGFPDATGEPPKQLKGYQKVYLEPGESRYVQLPLTPDDLSIWDTEADSWVTTPGDYQVMVGTSSADLPLRSTLTVWSA